MKFFLPVVLILIFLAVITYQPRIFIGTDNKTIFIANVKENLPLTIEFLHSVQKTPVIEELEYRNGEFILIRTKYKSQGVGLPFDAGDGIFYRDGEWFVFDDMNRHFKTLELRTGKNTNLKITLDGKTIELYKKFPLGTKIIVKTF